MHPEPDEADPRPRHRRVAAAHRRAGGGHRLGHRAAGLGRCSRRPRAALGAGPRDADPRAAGLALRGAHGGLARPAPARRRGPGPGRPGGAADRRPGSPRPAGRRRRGPVVHDALRSRLPPDRLDDAAVRRLARRRRAGQPRRPPGPRRRPGVRGAARPDPARAAAPRGQRCVLVAEPLLRHGRRHPALRRSRRRGLAVARHRPRRTARARARGRPRRRLGHRTRGLRRRRVPRLPAPGPARPRQPGVEGLLGRHHPRRRHAARRSAGPRRGAGLRLRRPPWCGDARRGGGHRPPRRRPAPPGRSAQGPIQRGLLGPARLLRPGPGRGRPAHRLAHHQPRARPVVRHRRRRQGPPLRRAARRPGPLDRVGAPHPGPVDGRRTTP